jgi:GTP-binding protein EngB required for normal cell division
MSGPPEQDPLKVFKSMQRELAALIARQRAVADVLESAELHEAATALLQRVNEDVFRVLVLGEFKRGKSTVVNALLGEKVLPAFARPCTAVISEVKYGEERRAVLHPHDGRPPIEIPVERLAEFITIDDEAEAARNEYQLAEIYWPLELCRDGVQLADSPGTNEDAIRDEVTGGYLSRADAIVYVIAATSPFSESERRYLETFVLPLGHRDIFFVITRIDQLDDAERDKLVETIRRRLSRIGADGPRMPGDAVLGQRLFPVDGRGALEARLAKDEERVGRCGLTAFEDSLRLFLTREKGRVKLAGASRELRVRLAHARALIREREHMYQQELAELEARYDAQRPRLEQLEQKRAIIVGAFDNDIRGLERNAEDAFRARLAGLAAQCPQWAAEAEVESRISSVMKAKTQAEVLAEELSGLLTDRLRYELQQWQAADLVPMLLRQLEPIRQRLDGDVAEFLGQVQDVRAAITGEAQSPVSGLSDILSGASGRVLGDSLSIQAGQASRMSVGGMLLPQLGVLIAGAILSFTPLGLLAAMVGAGLLQRLVHVDKITEDVRRKVGEAFAAQVREKSPDVARAAGRDVGDELRDLAAATDQALAMQTATVSEQVNATIRDKKAGEEKVARQREELRLLMLEVEATEQARGSLADRIDAY